MDSCCKRIADLLYQGSQPSPRTLAKLVEKTGLARSTVLSHLKHLKTKELLNKEEILQERIGRPKVLYKPSPRLLETFKTKSD